APFGFGDTPIFDETPRPRPAPTQQPESAPSQEQASGGCTRAEDGWDAAILASVVLLGLLWRRRR
ncbi:MAG: hypothetical protein OXK21_06045, partial [Chloroflexota bacterium]|nr:hypothetical protein [Chloroflexota bacterium]